MTAADEPEVRLEVWQHRARFLVGVIVVLGAAVLAVSILSLAAVLRLSHSFDDLQVRDERRACVETLNTAEQYALDLVVSKLVVAGTFRDAEVVSAAEALTSAISRRGQADELCN